MQEEKIQEGYRIAYIGERKKAFDMPFSIPSAIFGPFYFLYRKDWSLSIVLMICYFASHVYMIQNSITDDLGLLLRFIINIIYAFLFNNRYLSLVDKKIAFILKANPDKTKVELIEECKKQGRTLHIGIVLVIMILYVIGIVLLNNAK
jgi:hypothetical protein